MALKVGDEAPDFELRSHRGGTVKLSDFRGKRQVVVAFHPLAFTPVCAAQMCGYEVGSEPVRRRQCRRARDQRRRPAGEVGVGPGSRPDFVRFAERLPSPRGRREKYGVYRAKDGISERAIFVVDNDGRIAWAKVYDIPQQPDNADLFAALS